MSQFILTVHLIVSLILIFVVLIQGGKGGLGRMWGGSSTIVSSSNSENIMTRLTSWSAIIFMITSMSLSYLYSVKSKESLLQGVTATPLPTTKK